MARNYCVVGLGAIAIACGMVSSSVGAQEMIDLPEQDGAMSADFEEVFRIGSFDGETWETFGERPRVQMITAGPGGGRQQVSQDGIKQMTFYPELPVLMAVDASWSGKIWVQRRGKEPTEEGPIDILTPAGQYVGTFPMGATEIPAAFGPDGLAAYVETDDFEVPVGVVRRLPPVVN
ncbi:MAG: hypothetical protein OSA81_05045 [Longimicrobiales bacterium]|nr:hypothetical protein [Longimicrobiales bacterium]